jgi:rare lipoprotein A
MPSIKCAGTSCVEMRASDIPGASLAGDARVGKFVRWFAIALSAASLAACAQSSVVSRNSGFVGTSRQASLQPHRTAPFATSGRVASAKPRAPFAPRKDAAETQTASQGLASFYTEGTRTANGEKFDTHELTAAHPTLPFGTRLRVTNVATGRSVTVRVNDRGSTFVDELSTSHILPLTRWEWLEGVLRRSSLTSSNSRTGLDVFKQSSSDD